MSHTTELYGTLLEKQDEISKITQRMNRLLDEKAKLKESNKELKEDLTFYKLYKHYVYKDHEIIDAEASGYADGDEEYEENFKQR